MHIPIAARHLSKSTSVIVTDQEETRREDERGNGGERREIWRGGVGGGAGTRGRPSVSRSHSQFLRRRENRSSGNASAMTSFRLADARTRLHHR